MLLDFLPQRYLKLINEKLLSEICEIRLRKGFNVKVLIVGQGYVELPIICTINDLEYIISFVTHNSIYAFTEQIKQGFITTDKNVRIGLCGECVFDKDIITIKNFSSLNIRIPNQVINCSSQLKEYIFNGNKVRNSLIISPPGRGKTTMLKDLAKWLNDSCNQSILIVDERGEFGNVSGENIDVIKYCNKNYAFTCGIRSMSPSVIITDELVDKNDWQGVDFAVKSGINVIASCHGENLSNIKSKMYFIDNIFDNYFILSKSGKFGLVDKLIL